MSARTRPAVRLALAIVVLAPIAAAVMIALLLLLGVTPHLVFLPGHAVRSAFAGAGNPVHKFLGVLTTVLFWWALIVIAGLAVRRWSRRNAGPAARSGR